MPITKVPIIHKFGIISHSQRLELQERLLKQSYLKTLASKKLLAASSRNQLEVSEEFVQQYNSAQSLSEQERLEKIAHKMLERIKRRAGLKDGGLGGHVDLPVAWTELAQLAQCKDRVQEECLDVMITSLDQAPLEKEHIPALFYLAETTLYWLRTEAIHQPYLRTGEIKLLRMGQLVFMRLFFHHMSGNLQGHDEFKNRLFTYLDGFVESQEVYSPYPNALLCLRYINEVGKIVIGDCNTEAGEIKEGDSIKVFPQDSNPMDSESSELFHEVSANYDGGTRSSQSAGAISSSVHDLSPTLWHSLDVWRCVRQLGGGLKEALHSLANCGQGLANESWIDGMCALHILTDAAKGNLTALRVMQNLARGELPSKSGSAPSSSRLDNSDQSERGSPGDHDHGQTDPHKTIGALSDIYEKSEEYNSSSTPSRHISSSESTPSPKHAHKTSLPGSTPETREAEAVTPEDDTAKRAEERRVEEERVERAGEEEGKEAGEEAGLRMKSEVLPQMSWLADAGTDLQGGRESPGSSVHTYTNAVYPDSPGLHGWHWEVATTYADMLADICLHGASSNIQKVALVGKNKDVSLLHRMAAPKCPMESAGLLDMVYFKASNEAHDGGPNDWSWRVRYSAIQGLVKICRCCSGDSNKDGLRTVAWNTLLNAHSMEKDNRVLEALKVGQVDANIEKLLSKHLSVTPSTIGAKVAQGLSVLYLPPLPLAVVTTLPKKPKGKKIVTTHPVSRKPFRTTLNQEIQLATALYDQTPSFNSRTNFDLKRIVEDQWRKELQGKLEDEKEEREKQLKDKQKLAEEEEKKREESRKSKLGSKYKSPSYMSSDKSTPLKSSSSGTISTKS